MLPASSKSQSPQQPKPLSGKTLRDLTDKDRRLIRRKTITLMYQHVHAVRMSSWWATRRGFGGQAGFDRFCEQAVEPVTECGTSGCLASWIVVAARELGLKLKCDVNRELPGEVAYRVMDLGRTGKMLHDGHPLWHSSAWDRQVLGDRLFDAGWHVGQRIYVQRVVKAFKHFTQHINDKRRAAKGGQA